MKGTIDYGSWKDGSSIFKNNKGYYIVNIKKTGEEYKKYLKNWKPSGEYAPLYLDYAKEMVGSKSNLEKIKK